MAALASTVRSGAKYTEPSYDYPAKRKFRQAVWDFADRALEHVEVQNRNVLYLDSGQALETQFLLDKGYKSVNMRCVNNSPAVHANITRKVPAAVAGNMQRSTADVFLDIRNMMASGVHLHVVHADLCQQITPALLNRLAAIGSSDDRPDVMAVTVSCFHEHFVRLPPADRTLMNWSGRFDDGTDVVTVHDQQRVGSLIMALSGDVGELHAHNIARVKFGTYMSPARKVGKGMRMLWMAVAYANFR